MLTLVLLWILCILYAYILWIRKSQDTDNEPPALPGAWPVVGHVMFLVGDSCYLWRTIKDVVHKSYVLGGVISASVGPRTIYVITDPDDFFTIANTCVLKDGFYSFAKPWLGEGLATSNKSKWRYHRKLLNPAFSYVVLSEFIDIFNRQSRKFVKDLEIEAGNGLFDHWVYTRHNALETICLTALGVDFSDHNLLNSQYVAATEQIFNIMVYRFQKFWLHSSYMFRWTAAKKKQNECIKILHKLSNTVLQRRKLQLNRDISKDTKTDKSSGLKCKVFMDLLLELSLEKGVFNDREIREQVDTMIIGGYDTTANVLMYIMILLGSHPKVQERIYDELDEIFGDTDRDVEKHDLSKLVYIEAVLKESMRFYSIAPVIARKLDRNIKLKNYTLAAGRTCFMFIYGIHRHPMWGKDVDEFKPERWLDPASLPANPYAFAAFGIGRRMCIGKSFAFMSLKTTLVHLMRHYRIHADHRKLRLKLDVMLKPDSGHYISIEKRTQWKTSHGQSG